MAGDEKDFCNGNNGGVVVVDGRFEGGGVFSVLKGMNDVDL